MAHQTLAARMHEGERLHEYVRRTMASQSPLGIGYNLLKTGTLWASYAKANPAEAATLDAYLAAILAGSPPKAPTVKTATGQGLIDVVAAGFPFVAPPTPIPTPTPTPTNWTAALPGSTGQKVTTISHPPGAGVNLHSASDPMTVSDTTVIGGADQSFLVQPGAPGRTFQRCYSQNSVADGQSVSGNNKHAFYVKAANITCLDFTGTAAPQADGGTSVRFAGWHGERINLTGYQLPLCVFADDETHGQVLWKDVYSVSRSTPIWLDCDEAGQMVYDVVLDNCKLIGPAPWLAVNTANFAGTVTVRNGCAWAAKVGDPWQAITPSMCRGVPASKLAISA